MKILCVINDRLGPSPTHANSVTTRTTVNSHLCVMIGASVALSQSQHIGQSHYTK